MGVVPWEFSDSSGSSGNHYLPPDCIPPTLDAKKTPLALLVQTCSQIGADSSNGKSLLPQLDKSTKSSSPKLKNNKNQTQPSSQQQSSISSDSRLAFKPYEENVLIRKSETPRPSSKQAAQEMENEKRRSPNRKSVSPAASESKSSPAPIKSKSESPSISGASPIISSGMEVLSGHTKDLPMGSFKPPSSLGLGGLSSACCPPGVDATNPAFRPPLTSGSYSTHQPLMLGGYPTASPYVSFARVKTPTGGEAFVPVCKDPFCTRCPFSMHNPLVGSCPSGCTQCEHQKFGIAATLSNMIPPAHNLLNYPFRNNVCSWRTSGDTYCGKQFATPDDLLQHLRTHTASVDLLNPLGYSNPPLSPLSPHRYHPYAKPVLSSLASPYSAYNPSLAQYYSPYLYAQRLGADR